MADDDDTQQATEQPVEQPPAEPTLDELRAQLDQERAQNKLYKDTLAALGSGSSPQPGRTESPSPTAAGAPSDAQLLTEIAKETGFDEATLAPHLNVFRAMLRREATPVINTILGLADRQSRMEARFTVKDWDKIEKEANKVATEYRNRGVMLSYEDAAALAKARLGPVLEAAHSEEQESQQRERATAARTSGETRGTQKPGPSPNKTPARPKTKEEIERLPREEREKALTEALGDVGF